MEADNGKKRVLIISRNYNNLLCMARSLAGGDYDIEMVRLIQLKYKFVKVLAGFSPERKCRYVKKYHICQTNWNPDIFVDFLLNIHDPKRPTLIIPCDDLALPWIDENHEKLSGYYSISDVKGIQGELAKLMNKQEQKKLAIKAGLPAAGSHDIHVIDGKYDFPEGITYPCFVKPAVLVMGSKDFLKRYDSEEELLKAVDIMAGKFKNLDILVEDFIEIRKEYAILGMSIKGEVFLPNGCLEFLQGAHGSRKGIMVTGRVVSDPDIVEFLGKLKAFMKEIRYTGLFDVDALLSDQGILFCELNLRFGGSGYAITASGVNLPRMYAEYMLLGKEIDKKCELTGIGKTFVSEKVLLEDCTEKFITKAEADEIINSADIHFVKNDDDPLPYKAVLKQFKYSDRIMMKMKNVYKKLRH